MNEVTQFDEQFVEPPIGAYTIFVVAITVLSMFGMAVVAIPFFDAQAKQIASLLDSFLSLLFFLDFIYLLFTVSNRRAYLLRWGWVDLLGSIPSLYWLRLLRLSRAYRIVRRMQRYTPEQIQDILSRRPDRNTFFSIAFLSIVLVSASSYAIFRFEQSSVDKNITSAADAVWWSVVTITTVGYGDRYPTTNSGRMVAIFLMFVGIGIFSAFTSYLSTSFVNARHKRRDEQDREELIARFRTVNQQLDELSAEIKKLNAHLIGQGEQNPNDKSNDD